MSPSLLHLTICGQQGLLSTSASTIVFLQAPHFTEADHRARVLKLWSRVFMLYGGGGTSWATAPSSSSSVTVTKPSWLLWSSEWFLFFSSEEIKRWTPLGNTSWGWPGHKWKCTFQYCPEIQSLYYQKQKRVVANAACSNRWVGMITRHCDMLYVNG